MKYDYIYSEAADIITARKDEGTKFFTRDTLCLIVTESDKLFSSFNHTDYVDGKLVNGSSVKAALEKMSAAGETKIGAFIIMNCVDMVPVLPEKEDVEEITELDKFNSSSNVISPNNKYIMVKDLEDYNPEGDNSAIEILDVDINVRLDSKERKLDFTPDFNAVTDDGKSETKFLFAMPGSRPNDSGENPAAGVYRQEDVVNQYQPVDGIPGMAIGNGQVSNQFNRSQMFSQPYMQQGMMNPQYMQQGMMNSQYMQQGMMNPQYMQQGMMTPQYMQQGMMNPQYMQQGMVPPQYMQQGMMNPQYMQQSEMNPQNDQQNDADGSENGQQDETNQQHAQQSEMNPQYMQQGEMNPQYMQQGEMNPQYMQQGMMNPQYMQQGMVPPQYMQQSMMYMPGGMMPPQYPPFSHANGAPPQFEYPENYKGKKQ